MKIHSKKGFTLVELMVVAIIVAILAAVAIPLMSANKRRAMATEAEAGLGTIRSSLRALYAQTSDYTDDASGGTIGTGAVVGNVPGISDGDLDGRFFSDESYTITAVGTDSYVLQSSGDASTATEASEVAGVTITLDEDGEFTRTFP